MKFKDAYLMEMYPETVDTYGGEGQLISKFGIEVKNKIVLIVSQKRFLQETGRDRPDEGDLIWFPLSNSFFEILFVEDNIPFFELGKNFVFKIQCQTWNYGHEEISTTETLLDNFENNKNRYSTDLEDNDALQDFGNTKITAENAFGIKVK